MNSEPKPAVRTVTLNVRIAPEDKERLKRLALAMSPFSPLSEGKTISAALALAEKAIAKGS